MKRVDPFLLQLLNIWRKPTRSQRLYAGFITLVALLVTAHDAVTVGGRASPEMFLVLVPVLMGAFFFDEIGGILVGLVAGFALGPLVSQPASVWVTRLFILTFIGGAGGKLSHLLKNTLLDAEVRERQWRALSASMGDGILLMDTEARLVYMNPEAERLTGWNLGELQGKRAHEVLHFQDGEGNPIPIEECGNMVPLRTGRVNRVDHDTYTRKDGTKFPVAYTSTPVYVHGAITGTVSVFRDMTESWRLEEALRFESEMNATLARLSKQMETTLAKELEISNAIGELSSSLLSLAPVADVARRVLEHAKRLTESPTGFAGFFDRGSGKLIAPTLSDELGCPECAMKDQELTADRMGGLCKMVLDRRLPVLSNDLSLDPRSQGVPEGHIGISRFLSVPVMCEGEVLGQIAVANKNDEYSAQDTQVLERLAALYAVAIQRTWEEERVRDSEAKFREAFHETADALFLHEVHEDGSHGRILEVNDLACRRLGYSREELLTMTSEDLHLPEEHAKIMPQVASDLKTLGSVTYEIVEVARDGTQIPSEISSHVFTLGGRRVALSSARDIRRRKETEQALIAAKEEAEAANRAKSEFLSRTSHELRTPLNAILGFAQLLLMDPFEPLTDSQRESIEQIHRSGGHLLELINDVLDLARIEVGRVKVELDEVALNLFLPDVVALVSTQAQARSISITVQQESELEAVTADRTRLRQVLLNLMTNAVKYNHEGGFVRLETAAQPGGWLRISVTDNGPGIAPEEQVAIFEPFYRAAATSEVEGVGIGLSLTKALVDLMGGRMGLESTPSEGSTFWVELPIAGAAVEEVNTKVTAPLTAPWAPNAPVRTLLYVEDNPSNVALIERIVSLRSNLRLITAATAEEGFTLAIRHLPDLLLIDINLPDADGYSLLKRLRSKVTTWKIPAVAVSAAAMVSDVERGLDAGFEAYLTKPVDVPNFLAVIDRIFGAATEEAQHA